MKLMYSNYEECNCAMNLKMHIHVLNYEEEITYDFEEKTKNIHLIQQCQRGKKASSVVQKKNLTNICF